MEDSQFNKLCEENSFGAVARGEFNLIPRALLKNLVEKALAPMEQKVCDLENIIENIKQSKTEYEDSCKCKSAVIKKLLMSVTHDYFGIICEDVDGENWFDLRDRILGNKISKENKKTKDCGNKNSVDIDNRIENDFLSFAMALEQIADFDPKIDNAAYAMQMIAMLAIKRPPTKKKRKKK